MVGWYNELKTSDTKATAVTSLHGTIHGIQTNDCDIMKYGDTLAHSTVTPSGDWLRNKHTAHPVRTILVPVRTRETYNFVRITKNLGY